MKNTSKKAATSLSSSRDALNETSASSERFTGLELNQSPTKPQKPMDANSDQNIIVPEERRESVQSVSSNTSGNRSFLPPRVIEGSIDGVNEIDSFYRSQVLEDSLRKNKHIGYKCWMISQIPISIGAIIGLSAGLANPVYDVPAWTLSISIVLVIWNLIQCILEYRVIKSGNLEMAENLVKSFGIFMTVLFLATLAMLCTVFWKMDDMAGEVRVLIAAIIAFAVGIFYYQANFAGAMHVYQVLKTKTHLKHNILDEEAIRTDF